MRVDRSTTHLRAATVADAAAIAAIYNDGIAERVATFETRPRAADEIAALIRERDGRFPFLVADDDGRVVGWASVSPYSARQCYAGIAECSVHVARAVRGRGVGRELLDALVRACETRGFWKLMGRLFPENAASIAMCRAVGFRAVGTLERHAKLDGRWRDVIEVERLIGEAARGGAGR